MFFGEESASRVLQVEHTDHFVLIDERYRQFRSGLRIRLDVTRIFGDVRHQHRLPAFRGIAYQASSQRNVVLQMNIFVEAKREAVLQFLARGI